MDESYTLYLGRKQSGSIVDGATIEVLFPIASAYFFYLLPFLKDHLKL